MLDIPDLMDWSGADAQRVYVTATALNCREQPEIRPNNILTTFHRGDQLWAFFRVDEWICVQSDAPLPSATGYCYAAHLAPCLTTPRSLTPSDPPPPCITVS